MENAKPGVGCKVMLFNEALRAQALNEKSGEFQGFVGLGFFS